MYIDSYAILLFTASFLNFTIRHIPTEHHFHFGRATSFFLELLIIALHSSSVACWTHSDLGCSSPGVISFCLFILFMGCSRQEYWNGLLFRPLVDCVLSELFTMTHLSWATLHSMAHNFIQLCKPLNHNKAVIHKGDNIS